jgi:hypothetical protein
LLATFAATAQLIDWCYGYLTAGAESQRLQELSGAALQMTTLKR